MMPVFIRVFTCVLQRFLQCLHAFRCVLSVKKKDSLLQTNDGEGISGLLYGSHDLPMSRSGPWQ